MANVGDKFAQRVHKAHIYFTHYALFEEPDDGIPVATYIDAATGAPTQEFVLTPPINERVLTRVSGHPHQLTAPSETSELLPYSVSPPGFPPTPPPAPIAGLIAQVSGQPLAVVQANTNIMLVAIGQFLPDPHATTGKIDGDTLEVTRTVKFEVKVRIGFLFTPPSGTAAGAVGVLTGYLDLGTVHQLIGLPPPANPSQIVVYDWTTQMTLSTQNNYIRKVATEPKPVADPFDPGLKEIRFEGKPIDHDLHYRLVGHGAAGHVTFTAPPELEQFLFGTTSLTDVEFAVMEAGHLVPL